MKKIWIHNFLLLVCSLVFSQTLITGVVLDENGNGIPGVTIQIKGTTQGTITDANGSFVLKVNPEASLILSSVGFLTQEINASSEYLEITLKEDVSQLDDVIVTSVSSARRRTENIQKIPESIYAMGAEEIINTNITNIESFTQMVPNVSFNTSQNVGVNFISVRGIPQVRNGDAPIAFLVDDVFIPDANLINQELFDISSIEVIKGPQGTLYGKNAIGGAINIQTQAPTNKIKNQIRVGYGNGSNLRTGLSSSGAIIPNKVFYSVSGAYTDSDGVIENDFLNKEVDFFEDLSFRGKLLANITPRLKATISYQYIDTEGGATYYATPADGGTQMDATDFDYVINADQFGRSFLENNFGYLKVEYFFDNVYVRSVTSYNDAERNHRGDLDFTSLDVTRQDQDSNSETINQEVKVGSIGGNKLNWDAGLFYQHSERYLYTLATADFGFLGDPVVPTGVQSPLLVLSDYTNTFSTFAFYFFADYKLTDRLTLSAGLRFDSDDIEQDNNLTGTNPSKTQSELQPKASISYRAAKSVLIYTNYGRGYRSGGFNSEETNFFDAEFEGETSDNFEIGLKTNWLTDRLLFNMAAFYIDFQNQQQYAVGIGSTGNYIGNFNFPESEVFGLEADVRFKTSRYLDIIGGFGYTHSEIIEGGTAGTIDRTAFDGNKTPYIPKTTYNIALQSNFDFSDRLAFSGFINWTGKGKIYWHEDNAETDISDPFELLDSRLALTFKKKYTIAVWGRNLLDEEYWQEYFAQEFSGGGADIGWIGKPRTYGIEAIISF
ncbi:MAG: TonB-dependent receptor [Bacteroidota bacterium]